MANSYQAGETVICWRNVKDEDGNYVDPITSMKISVYDPHNGAEVENQAMVPDETGKYHYDYTLPSEAIDGEWWVKYVATDGSRITIFWDSFEVTKH